MQSAESSNWNAPYSGDIPHHYLPLPSEPMLTFHFGFPAPELWHGSVPRAARILYPLVLSFVLLSWRVSFCLTLLTRKLKISQRCMLQKPNRSHPVSSDLPPDPSDGQEGYLCSCAEKPLTSPLWTCPNHFLASEYISVTPRPEFTCRWICLQAKGAGPLGSITKSQQVPVQPSSCKALKGTRTL